MFLLTPRDIEILKALNRYRYLRANFIHRLVGGSKQHVQRRLGDSKFKGKDFGLAGAGFIRKPEQQLQSYNARYSPRVYELTPKGKEVLKQHGVPIRIWQGELQFWHRLMVADIVSSFEILAKMNGLRFRDQWDILGDKPLSLPTTIDWGKLHSDKPLEPDALFAFDNRYFLLEADRGTEAVERSNLHQTSYLRKLLAYRDIIRSKTTEREWGIPTPFVLTITTKPRDPDNPRNDRIENIKNLFLEIGRVHGQEKPKSYALAYFARPILGSFEKHPEPLLSLFDDQWERVGHPPLVIRNELAIGHTEATRPL